MSYKTIWKNIYNSKKGKTRNKTYVLSHHVVAYRSAPFSFSIWLRRTEKKPSRNLMYFTLSEVLPAYDNFLIYSKLHNNINVYQQVRRLFQKIYFYPSQTVVLSFSRAPLSFIGT